MFTAILQESPQRRATDHGVTVDIQLTNLAYQNLPAMLMVNLVATLGAAIVLYKDGFQFVVPWLVAAIALSVLRLVSYFYFNRVLAQQAGDLRGVFFWICLYGGGIITAAVIWDAAVLLSFQQAAAESKFTLIVIFSALAGGATGVTAPLKYVGRIYITILLWFSSLAIYWLSPEYWHFAVIGMVSWGVMLISHRNNHNILRESITLKLENIQLVENLQYLNTNLEQRVNRRTEDLRRVAHHDALTGLPNRLGLAEWMEQALNPENYEEAAVFFLDLDRFKQINDALGHEVGDQVLRMIAFRFNDVCPDYAILARWGGDEFLLVTRQTAGIRQRAKALAEELINVATAPLRIQDQSLGLGLSVGIAYYPTDATNFKDIIHAADLTVAEVKRGGRGHSLIYNDIYADTQKRRFELGRALTEAIKQNELTLVYQPLVDSQTGEIEAVEALTRWHHAVLGEIDPCEFIYLAEETDHIIALGDWVLSQACTRAKQWRELGANIKIAVNISTKQLLSPGFPGQVAKILRNIELPPDALILEVTESLFNQSYSHITLQTVKNLRELAVEVYIDDFGTGYSSLSRLHEFPVSGIKIDRTFTKQLGKPGQVVIESAILIAQKMKLNVIVAGVENPEQVRQLMDLGIFSLQGFYFGQPTATPKVQKIDPIWLA